MKIGRIVCAGKVPGDDVQAAKKAVREAVNELDCNIITTPGGFVNFHIDDSYKPRTIGWKTSYNDFGVLASMACGFHLKLVDFPAFNKIITLGVDVVQSGIKIAELVVVQHPKAFLSVTGKTFPRTDEENDLVLAPVSSHFMRLNGFRQGGKKMMILGCHDLNVWSGRSAANSDPNGKRAQVRNHMVRYANDYKPDVVLHHPHATDTDKTWTAGWGGVKRQLAPESWASGLGYYNDYGRRVEGFRQPLEKVQAAYHSNNVNDMVMVF